MVWRWVAGVNRNTQAMGVALTTPVVSWGGIMILPLGTLLQDSLGTKSQRRGTGAIICSFLASVSFKYSKV